MTATARQPARPVMATGTILGYLPYARELELRITEPEPEPPLRSGQTVHAAIHIPLAQAHDFAGLRGETVTITLTPSRMPAHQPPWLAINCQPAE